jgi:hypothetical protein
MKPCPFCGSKGDVRAVETTEGYQEHKVIRYQPYCTNLRCGIAIHCQATTARAAVERWDERQS